MNNILIRRLHSREIFIGFLLDENVTSGIGKCDLQHRKLRKLGIVNGEVAQIALNERAIIITFDSDFLHLKQQLQAKLGIIFIKMDKINPKLARFLLEKHFNFCLNHLKLPGKCIISESDCVFKNPQEK